MRILLVGKFYTEGFAQHIAETLEEMGHQVFRFEPGIAYPNFRSTFSYQWFKVRSVFFQFYSKSSLYERVQTRKLLAAVKGSKPEIVLSCHDFITSKQAGQLKAAYPLKLVLWYPDHIGLFARAMFLNAPYDVMFFKDPYIVQLLQSEFGKQKVYYLPECCNPKYHKPVELSSEEKMRYECEVTTAGNLHSSRAAVFEHLKEFDCKIWGNPAPNWLHISAIQHMIQNRFVANEEKAKAFRGAKIVLNTLQPGEIWGVNVRTFEIAAAGGFQIMPYRKELQNLFAIGDEVVVYRSIKELQELIRFYLANPLQRHAVAERACKRAHQEHTYTHRLQKLINIVNRCK